VVISGIANTNVTNIASNLVEVRANSASGVVISGIANTNVTNIASNLVEIRANSASGVVISGIANTNAVAINASGTYWLNEIRANSASGVVISGIANTNVTNIATNAADIIVVSGIAEAGGGGDITAVVAGDGLSGGATSGSATVTLDLNELTEAAVADGDFIAIIDTNDSNTSRKEAVHDVATLFAGAGLTATNSVIAVDTLNQNTTGSAGTLSPGRTINGVAFDGSANITVTAAGSTLSDTVTVAKGGAGQTSYTNGQLLIGNTTGNTLAKATLTAGSNVTITNGTGSITIAATDTNTTYAKADFDLDHLFTLVGAAADTSEHLGTFTGSTISDSQTIKASIQALETAVETKGVTAGSSSILTVGALDAGSITSGFGAIATADTISGTTITASTALKTPLIEYTDGDDAITVNDGGSVTFGAATKPVAPVAGGTSGTITLDCNTSNYFTIAADGNIAGLDFTNATLGQRIIVRITSDGSHTIAFGSDTVHFPGGTEPVLTVSGTDVYGFLCTTASSAFDGFIIGQDIKA